MVLFVVALILLVGPPLYYAIRGAIRGEQRADTPEIRAYEKAIDLSYPGALGVTVVAVIQFIQLEAPLPYPLNLSMYCFAFAMPLLALEVLLDAYARGRANVHRRSNYQLPQLVAASSVLRPLGLIAFFFGMAYIFAYFSLVASLIFACTSSLVFQVQMYHSPGLPEIPEHLRPYVITKWLSFITHIVFQVLLWGLVVVGSLYVFAPTEWLDSCP